MAKRVPITDAIKSKITAAVNDEIDYEKIVVFEACAASTRPISQKGGPYDKARLTENYLNQMAACLPEQQITLQVMHEDRMLPVGKVFAAQTYPADNGETDLNVLFYMDAESEHVKDIDLAIIDEVSIGALPKHAFCSECDFDFMSEPYAMWYGECENGHVLGENGCHLRVTELEKWKELSLVNRGASNNAKILGETKQRLGKAQFAELCSENAFAPMLYLFAKESDFSKPTNLGDHSMDQKSLELAQTAGRLEFELKLANSEKEKLELQLTASQEKVTSLTEQVKTLEANSDSGKVAELEQKLSDKDALLSQAAETIKPQYEIACSASGQEIKADATLAEMVETIDKAQIKLAAVPRGSEVNLNDGDELEVQAMPLSHFVTKR